MKMKLFSIVAGTVFCALILSANPALAQDSDGDLMPDSHENTFGCLMPNTVDAAVDYDADGMTSLAEYTYSPLLNPCAADTDLDSAGDLTDNCRLAANPSQSDLEWATAPGSLPVLTDDMDVFVWAFPIAETGVTVHDGNTGFISDNNDNFYDGAPASVNLGTVGARPYLKFWIYLPTPTSDMLFQVRCDTDWNHRFGFSTDGVWNGYALTRAGTLYNLPQAQWVSVILDLRGLGCGESTAITGMAFSTQAGNVSYFDSVTLHPTYPLGDACDFASDFDGDGMSDGWEVQAGAGCGLNPLVGDSAGNPDGDAFNNLAEYQHNGNPCAVTACSDGLDNDGDSWLDLLDPGCADLADISEQNNLVACDNGLDDDLDGYIDYPAEPDCTGSADTLEMKPRPHLEYLDGYYAGYTSIYPMGDTPLVTGYLASFIMSYDVSNPLTPTHYCYESTRGWPFDVVVGGDYAYVASDYGLEIMVAPDGCPTFLAGYYAISDTARGIAVRGDYAYVAASGAGLRIINVSDPGAPTPVGFYDTPGSASGLFVLGDYVFIADSSSGLQIVNVSNPASPSLAGTFDTPGSASGVFVSGNYAYVADSGSGLQIIDVSNPANPTLAGSYNLGLTAHNVFVRGAYAYVASVAGMDVVSVASPSNPMLAGEYMAIGSGRDLYVSGNYAYLVDDDVGLNVISLNDRDGDGISDWYEQEHSSCLNVNAADSDMDPDADGLTNHQDFFGHTDPCDPDTDNDGLNDGFEIRYPSCLSPLVPQTNLDIDSDNLINSAEYSLGTNPCAADTDHDGLNDGVEVNTVLTDPLIEDSDDDGISDGDEILIWQTNPFTSDTDGDGLSDYQEVVTYHTNPWLIDSDGDGLADGGEVWVTATDPLDPDSDHDGIPDGEEGGSPLTDNDGDNMPMSWEDRYVCVSSSAGDSTADPDFDGLTNIEEYNAATNPCEADTDSDGLDDGEEVNTTLTDPASPDTDGDGLTDGGETVTDPLDPDSDNDGYSDGAEISASSDPNNPGSIPPQPQHLINYQGRITDAGGAAITGPVNMTFSLFGSLSGGTALWIEAQTVTVTQGIYNVLLGSVTPLDPSIFSTTLLYLEVTASGETLSPRSRITSAPFAIKAEELLGGRLEMDTRNLTIGAPAAAATVHVAFNRAFVSPPRVVVSALDGKIGGVTFIVAQVSNISAYGFDVSFESNSGVAAAGSADFTYQAFGK